MAKMTSLGLEMVNGDEDLPWPLLGEENCPEPDEDDLPGTVLGEDDLPGAVLGEGDLLGALIGREGSLRSADEDDLLEEAKTKIA